MTNEWESAPNVSRWYGEVICEPLKGGDVDYFYGYSNAIDPPDVDLLVPEGWRLLESKVQTTAGHPDHQPNTDGQDQEVRDTVKTLTLVASSLQREADYLVELSGSADRLRAHSRTLQQIATWLELKG